MTILHRLRPKSDRTLGREGRRDNRTEVSCVCMSLLTKERWVGLLVTKEL